MHLADQITLRLGALPADKLQEVLDFIEFLQTRIKSDEPIEAQPFKGMPVSYADPTAPVAADDWEAARDAAFPDVSRLELGFPTSTTLPFSWQPFWSRRFSWQPFWS